MTYKIAFEVPIKGGTKQYAAVLSERKQSKRLVVTPTPMKSPNDMLVLNERQRIQSTTLFRFMTIKVEALIDDDVTPAEFLGVEVTTSWRGIPRFQAIYMLNDCNSEIKFNRWDEIDNAKLKSTGFF